MNTDCEGHLLCSCKMCVEIWSNYNKNMNMISNKLLQEFNFIKDKVFNLKKYRPQGDTIEGILLMEDGVKLFTSSFVSGHGHQEAKTFYYSFYINYEELQKPDEYHLQKIEEAKKEQEQIDLAFKEKIKERELLELKRLKEKYE